MSHVAKPRFHSTAPPLATLTAFTCHLEAGTSLHFPDGVFWKEVLNRLNQFSGVWYQLL